MFDCHYDLLTYIYMNRKNLNPVIKHCNEIFYNNITGGIFNLFYMSEKEMKDELGIDKKDINLIQNLKDVNYLIRRFRIIPSNINYIIGIEGLDYLEKIEDIDILYALGLRSVGIVWNNQNKFGGGSKTSNKYGLTKLGEELIEKLVKKNIAIDLSHCNDKTFYDIIYKCKSLKLQGFEPIVFASHSNCNRVCNNLRNLTDDQIKNIKSLGGVIGVVSIKKFCSNSDNASYELEYIKHIDHLKRLLGSIESVAIATDDMSYYNIEPEYYKNMNIFKHKEVRKQIQELLLKNGYTKDEIFRIMYRNVYDKLLTRLHKV